jgi:hypothetical protein
MKGGAAGGHKMNMVSINLIAITAKKGGMSNGTDSCRKKRGNGDEGRRDLTG